MVGIVAVTRFCEAGSSTFASYIDYVDRKEAVRKDNKEKLNIFDTYMDYMDNDAKTIMEEGKRIEQMSALFTKDKDILTKEEKADLKEIFKTAQKNGSNMWQTVISFDNAYLEEIGIYNSADDTLNEKILRQAARRAIGDMLKNEGLENATWTASFHRNTDNIHIHIATVEPTPMREKRRYVLYEKDKDGELPRDKDGKPIKKPVKDEKGNVVTYMGYKGTFKGTSIAALKSAIRSELENNKEVYKEITRLLRENIINDKKTRNLMDDPDFSKKMYDLYNELQESSVEPWNWNYNQSRMRSFKAKINDLSNDFINAYHKDDFDNFTRKIEREAMRQVRSYGGKKNDYVRKMLYGKEGIYARLGNTILSELKAYNKYENERKNHFHKAVMLLKKDNLFYDPVEALSILNREAKKGNSYAQAKMGFLYLRGEYVERNIDTAKAYFKSAANNGNELGKKMLEELEKNKIFGMVLKYNRQNDRMRYAKNYAFRRGLRFLENELNRNYEKARNMYDAEMLQREIDQRGQEI